MASVCAKISAMTFSCYSVITFVVLLVSFIPYCKAQSVPAMYVFGDSLVDVGNNNYLALSTIKADFPHNGIDYAGHVATGRFSNGRNAADFIAEKLGLPTPPPYLSKPNGVFIKGVSFASGGAGILNDTNESRIKRTIPLTRQVRDFDVVRQGLVKELGAVAAEKHLSASLFPLVIGSNDIINYFNDESKQSLSPQQYVTLMISTLKDLLKELYGLGARKFLVVGLVPIGCAPKQRFRNPTGECNNKVSYSSSQYNQQLVQMLAQLKSELKEFQYSYFDIFSIYTSIIQNPATYGFNETKAACCGLGRLRADLPCTPISLMCSDRSRHLFWDIYHPTEAAAHTVINMLVDGPANLVSPITFQQLIAT